MRDGSPRRSDRRAPRVGRPPVTAPHARHRPAGTFRDRWGALAARALRSRRLVRAPLLLYRHRLGWLLGQRFLLLEHTGRSSGLARHAVLEVVERPDPATYRVISGLGADSQWFRNIQTEPRVRVSVGRVVRRPATAHIRPPDEARTVLGAYADAHPAAWAALAPVLTQVVGGADPYDGIPVVDLRLDAVP